MLQFLQYLPEFLVAVFSNWLLLASSGTIMFFLGIYEKYRLKRSISWRLEGVIFLCFLFFACFQAWRDEHRIALNSQVQIETLQTKNQTMKSDLGKKNVKIATLQEQIQDQQTTIDHALVQLGKAEQPEKLNITAYWLGQVSTQTYKSSERYGTFLVLTNKVVTPVRLVVACQASIMRASGSLLGAGGSIGGGWGGHFTDQQFGVGILSPAWTPASPLLVTVFTNAKNLGRCEFEEK